jgi:hypothetical protein
VSSGLSAILPGYPPDSSLSRRWIAQQLSAAVSDKYRDHFVLQGISERRAETLFKRLCTETEKMAAAFDLTGI